MDRERFADKELLLDITEEVTRVTERATKHPSSCPLLIRSPPFSSATDAEAETADAKRCMIDALRYIAWWLSVYSIDDEDTQILACSADWARRLQQDGRSDVPREGLAGDHHPPFHMRIADLMIKLAQRHAGVNYNK